MMTTSPPATSIPLVDLQAQTRTIRSEIDEAIAATIDQTAFIMGGRVSAFEEEFARYCGSRFAVGASSGTTALHAALVAAGVGAGDEVITASHTFIATAEAIVHCGATPVFVDVEAETHCIDASTLEAAITPRTKAIIPVHLYGQVADMEGALTFARSHGLTVIEDAAQAHGAQCLDARAGAVGDLGCFSFYPGKNLGAFGDAGMITTSDEGLVKRLRLLVNHGRHTKYEHQIIGHNYRLDALQAAILSVKLRHLDDWTRARRDRAHRYNALLADLPVDAPIEKRDHVYHLYVIQCEDREALGSALRAEGISTGIHYPIPLHLQPCFRDHPQAGRGRLPVTERLADRILSLPLFPELTDEQQDRVVDAISRFFG